MTLVYPPAIDVYVYARAADKEAPAIPHLVLGETVTVAYTGVDVVDVHLCNRYLPDDEERICRKLVGGTPAGSMAMPLTDALWEEFCAKPDFSDYPDKYNGRCTLYWEVYPEGLNESVTGSGDNAYVYKPIRIAQPTSTECTLWSSSPCQVAWSAPSVVNAYLCNTKLYDTSCKSVRSYT
eukprot:tig00021374_g21117.t1